MCFSGFTSVLMQYAGEVVSTSLSHEHALSQCRKRGLLTQTSPDNIRLRNITIAFSIKQAHAMTAGNNTVVRE